MGWFIQLNKRLATATDAAADGSTDAGEHRADACSRRRDVLDARLDHIVFLTALVIAIIGRSLTLIVGGVATRGLSAVRWILIASDAPVGVQRDVLGHWSLEVVRLSALGVEEPSVEDEAVELRVIWLGYGLALVYVDRDVLECLDYCCLNLL